MTPPTHVHRARLLTVVGGPFVSVSLSLSLSLRSDALSPVLAVRSFLRMTTDMESLTQVYIFDQRDRTLFFISTCDVLPTLIAVHPSARVCVPCNRFVSPL